VKRYLFIILCLLKQAFCWVVLWSGGALLCRPQHSPPLGCICKSSIQTKIRAPYVKTTSVCPSVTQNQRLHFCLISMKFGTGWFKKSCLSSVSFMECSESHILLQGIYNILLIFSTFPNASGKQKQVGKGGLHKTASFVRPGIVKYIHYLEVQMNLFW